jgi:long-chain fatty acid transport protein
VVQNIVLRNSFNPVGAGARGLGMGGAFTAVADDGTAASFNPAGLAQLRRTELALVGFADQLTSDLREPGQETVRQRSRHGRPDFAGVSVPFEVGGRNLTVELAYQRAIDLFGSGTASVARRVDLSQIDPDNVGVGSRDFVIDLTPQQSGGFHTYTLSAGYQASPHLALGLSLGYWRAGWSATGTARHLLRTRRIGSSDVLENPLRQEVFRQDQGMDAMSLGAGFLLRHPRVSVGGVLRLPFSGRYRLDETKDTTTYDDEFFPSDPFRTTFKATTRLRWPGSSAFGVAFRPVSRLTVAGEVSLTTWSHAVLENVPDGALLTQDANQPTFTDRNFFDLLPASQTATSDTTQWRAGAEYLVHLPGAVLPLRAGVFRDRSPVGDPATLEGRPIRGLTVGTGLNFDRFVVDVALERRRSSGNVGLLFEGSEQASPDQLPVEDVREYRVVASLLYRFPASADPVKALLRRIFVGESDDR